MDECIQLIYHGDAVVVRLGYLVNGQEMREGEYDELEFSFGDLRFTLSGGDITWNQELGAYCVFLTQTQTFGLGDVAPYQLRVKVGDLVGASKMRYKKIGKVKSDQVL
ncbi:MAG: hypothetical protein IJM76_06015 [Lachnospiraceae bacterium]|nr:hypothetical protein [Lachnospiraceae bacterium]